MTYFISHELYLARRNGPPPPPGCDKNGIKIAENDIVSYEPEDDSGNVLYTLEGCTVKKVFPNGRVTIEHPSFIGVGGIHSPKNTALRYIRKTS